MAGFFLPRVFEKLKKMSGQQPPSPQTQKSPSYPQAYSNPPNYGQYGYAYEYYGYPTYEAYESACRASYSQQQSKPQSAAQRVLQNRSTNQISPERYFF